jgi:hypothetical protein
MAIKAVAVDDSGTHHLIVGLNRENVESLLRGGVVTLPPGYLRGLTENRDVVVLFAESDAIHSASRQLSGPRSSPTKPS